MEMVVDNTVPSVISVVVIHTFVTRGQEYVESVRFYPLPASAVKDGKVTVRLEADNGLAVYGPAFGRYPFGPHIGLVK